MSDGEWPLRRGDVVWAAPDPIVGREQQGRRPALIIAGHRYIERIGSLVIFLHITTRDRGWPSHVRLGGPELTLEEASFAITEQVRTIDRRRIIKHAGRVDADTLTSIDRWLHDHLGLDAA